MTDAVIATSPIAMSEEGAHPGDAPTSRRFPQRALDPGDPEAATILSGLACGVGRCGCVRAVEQGHGVTHCPAHQDDDPSLSVTVKDGKVLVHCFGGCSQDAVIEALRERDVWPRPDRRAAGRLRLSTAIPDHPATRPVTTQSVTPQVNEAPKECAPVLDAGLTVEQLAAAKGLDLDFLRSLGVRDGIAFESGSRRSCVDIPYRDELGTTVSLQKRLRLNDPDRFKWPSGNKAIAYGLDRLANDQPGTEHILVEGASDCWTCWPQGIGTLGLPGASTWNPHYVPSLSKGPVFVWQEPGGAGQKFVDAISRDIPDARVIIAPEEAKDPNALWQLDPAGFVQRMRDLMDAAPSAREIKQAAAVAEAEVALAASGGLLDRPDLFRRIKQAMRSQGYAGDLRPPMLAYIALVSSALGRPLNLAFVAQSASGKNFAVDTALGLMPSDACHVIKAASARSLIYDGDADYEHRTVIFAEADSIPEDGPAASAVRNLATDNEMAYDVVERDKQTGKFTTRHIRKAGPTGLVTTSIKPLGTQMGTRMLTIGVGDSPAQTRAVLQAHALRVNGEVASFDPSALVASQTWLRQAGTRKVFIPYAAFLAAQVPAMEVRARRDFPQLLTVIQTVAFLHQRQRERHKGGPIVATVADYRRAYWLLGEVFTAAASGGVTEPMRAAAVAVADLYASTRQPVTQKAVADRLGVSGSTVWYRIKGAIRHGLVVNEESRKGRPALLLPGEQDPSPSGGALPTPGAVSRYLASSVRSVEPVTEQAAQQDAAGDSKGASVGHETVIEATYCAVPAEAGATQIAIQRFETSPAGLGDTSPTYRGTDAGAAVAADNDPMYQAALDFFRPCMMCGGMERWARPGDGRLICTGCHPSPFGPLIGTEKSALGRHHGVLSNGHLQPPEHVNEGEQRSPEPVAPDL